jgi:hypothetical protein
MAGSAYEQKILFATRSAGIATLAAAMIAASGRPYTIQEAADLFYELERAIYPAPASSARDTSARLSPGWR